MSARACGTGRSGTFGERSFAEVVARDIAALIAGFNQAALTEVEGDTQWRGISKPIPSTRRSLDWADEFVRERDRAARPCVSSPAVHPAGRQPPQGHRPAQGGGPAPGTVGDPPGTRTGRSRLRTAQARPAERDPGPIAVGANHIRLPGTRHRQCRDHRPLRHRRAEASATCARCSTASCSPVIR